MTENAKQQLQKKLNTRKKNCIIVPPSKVKARTGKSVKREPQEQSMTITYTEISDIAPAKKIPEPEKKNEKKSEVKSQREKSKVQKSRKT